MWNLLSGAVGSWHEERRARCCVSETGRRSVKRASPIHIANATKVRRSWRRDFLWGWGLRGPRRTSGQGPRQAAPSGVEGAVRCRGGVFHVMEAPTAGDALRSHGSFDQRKVRLRARGWRRRFLSGAPKLRICRDVRAGTTGRATQAQGWVGDCRRSARRHWPKHQRRHAVFKRE